LNNNGHGIVLKLGGARCEWNKQSKVPSFGFQGCLGGMIASLLPADFSITNVIPHYSKPPGFRKGLVHAIGMAAWIFWCKLEKSSLLSDIFNGHFRKYDFSGCLIVEQFFNAQTISSIAQIKGTLQAVT
jgi:hypothetical protein